MRVLSEADWTHWTTYGFVVVPHAVPDANVRRLTDLLWEFSEMRPDDPATWSRRQLRDHAMRELNNSGMVEIYNHQYLWDNRQEPRVYDAFVDIWDRTDLWVAIDRANLNTPNRRRPCVQRLHPLGRGHVARRRCRSACRACSRWWIPTTRSAAFSACRSCFARSRRGFPTQPADRHPMHPDLAGFEIVPVAHEGRATC